MDSTILLIVIFGLVLGLGTFVLLLIARRKKGLSADEEAFVRNQWRMIGRGQNPKNDIIEADKLLDFVLEKYGFTGSLGEKLKQAGSLFSDLNRVWVAHKMRNRFAHELDYQPSELEFRAALESFRKGLTDLKIKL
ncbi:MAG: hypothetical protein ABIH35_02690 [Patescibacteria group bacterium]